MLPTLDLRETGPIFNLAAGRDSPHKRAAAQRFTVERCAGAPLALV